MESSLKIEEIKNQLDAYKKQVEYLERELNRYKMASDGASDGLWDYDLVRNEPFISQPWKTMLGIKGDEDIDLEGLWEKRLHPDDKEGMLAKFQSFQEGKETTYNEIFRLLHNDGTYRWINSRAKNIKDDSGNVIRVSGSHTDITAKKAAEDALRESEIKYKMLFQNSLVGMFRTDLRTGEIIEANDKAWEIFGEIDKENQSTFDYYKDPNDREKIINAVRETGKAENLEVEVKRADGELIWVLFSASIDLKNNIIETIVIDITERKEAVLELQKVNFELDNFVYHASHDLRSPLSSILGLLNIYKKEDNPSVKADCIDRVENSVMRLDHLVHELLAISRNDRINDDHVSMNFLVEINNSISSYFSGLNSKQLDIHVRVHQPQVFISDLTRVRIILNNLISNAIKYRDLSKPMSIIEIDVAVDEEKAEIIIKDNGQGIPENEIGHIFEMFVRANENSEGSGLGLYIVKNVIEKLAGTIYVKSELEKGTTFNVMIPNNPSIINNEEI